ncbi:MAG: PKD domain-containing protein [Paludibacteraceae bacterium]|nr:PKD domain-containing protein [Paludibacteraceae bacterium]
MKHHFTIVFAILPLCFAWGSNPYIDRVYEYCPAPGQFVNTMPKATAEDTPASMAAKADSAITNHNQEMISLGGYGGYIVFGFDHEILNIEGAYDFKILGNSFYANANPNQTTQRGGSSEPGIVMVSRDDNHNGLPDDTWYELAGSEYYKPTTRHNYTITYYRTPSNHQATPNNEYKFLCDTTYIAWSSSTGEKGYMPKNTFHKQDYFPLWLGDSISFTGTIMANNGVDESGTGSYYVSYCFDWGYADDQPNELPDEPEMHASEFKIDWAVDADGNPVYLDGIQFVKVYTAINQYNGWLGECSTEILDAFDLHPCATSLEENSKDATLSANNPVGQGVKIFHNGSIRILRGANTYDILGRIINKHN